jgi:hypothetical protein
MRFFLPPNLRNARGMPMPRFEWEFEDEPKPPPSQTDGGESGDRRHRWTRRATVGLLLLAAVIIGVRALVMAHRRALEDAEAELRATVELELRSIDSGDAEVFAGLQDPVDADWRDAQLARYFSASETGFTALPGLVPAQRPAEITGIDLAGKRAQVEVTFWYDLREPLQGSRLPAVSPAEEQPSLEHSTAIRSVEPDPYAFTVAWNFRRTAKGEWTHAAPQAALWGEPYLTSAGEGGDGPLLQLEATSSEKPLIAPIGADLGRLLTRACQWLNCSPEAHYRLRFGDVAASGRAGSDWALPSAHLAGIPRDEGARSAWTHALQLWMVQGLVQAQFDEALFEGCAGGAADDARSASGGAGEAGDPPLGLCHRVMMEALVERVQAELGLVQRQAPDRQLLADAVAKGRQHALETVWAAGADPEDEAGSRLLRAEATAALNMLEDALGPELMFRLMPRLLERPGALDLEALFDLDRDSPSTAWYTYLSQLTGEPIVPLSTFPVIAPEDQHLDPPPVAAVQALAPDDQIALTCDSRIWVGRADGSGLVPLTPLGDRFGNPRWSPDGRWLLVRRLGEPAAQAAGNASSGKPAPGLTKETELVHTLYRFDAQEPRSRALVAGPVEEIRFWDLSPDGRLLIYETASDVRALDVETGEMRRLPAEPIWSPDGQQMVFSAGDPTRAWMAEADWGVPRQIAHPQGLAWSEAQWSPDERRLAMHLNRGYPYARRVAIYDLADQKIEAEFALYDLIRALARSDGDYLSTGAAPTGTDQRSSTTVWSEGWSADGRYLLLRGDWTKGPLGELDYSLLVAFPVGGGNGTPQVIAYGHETYMSNVAWSPTDPQRLIFKWRVAADEKPVYETHLVDLETGSLYSTADATYAEWAPDGAGAALLSADRITFVDSDGRERFSFAAPGACTDIDWNPAFDYGALGTP